MVGKGLSHLLRDQVQVVVDEQQVGHGPLGYSMLAGQNAAHSLWRQWAGVSSGRAGPEARREIYVPF